MVSYSVNSKRLKLYTSHYGSVMSGFLSEKDRQHKDIVLICLKCNKPQTKHWFVKIQHQMPLVAS